MMKKRRHLKLIYSRNGVAKTSDFDDEFGILSKIKMRLKAFFTPKEEKINALREIITRMYRDYEINVEKSETPYYIRAEERIRKIIKEHKVNHYYKRLLKFTAEI